MRNTADTCDVTDLHAWRKTAMGSQPGWEARAQVISHFVRPTDVVLDLGAGDQKLRKYLPARSRYIAVDCVDERPGTFVVDFNAEFRLPDCDFNVIVSAGFLEYISDLPQFMDRLAAACPGRMFIFTYHYTPAHPKKHHSLHKLNALRDAQECGSFFGRYVDDLHEVVSFKDQSLFIGVLSGGPKARLNSVPTINVALESRKPWPRWWLRVARRFQHTTTTLDLSATARAVRRQRLTYLSPQRLKRLEAVLCAVLEERTPGDVLEFGVALGGSGIVLASRARRYARAFHGFDVFGMIPAPTSDKDDAGSRRRYEVIASGQSQGIAGDIYYGYRQNLLEEVRASFARHGVPVDGKRIVLHKGLFQETWSDYQGRAVAFAHIDCDWYDPVKFCLERVAERLSPGGIIILDDFHDYGGCRNATTEFVSNRSEFTLEDAEVAVLRRSRAP
jgi:O-methyltransferase